MKFHYPKTNAGNYCYASITEPCLQAVPRLLQSCCVQQGSEEVWGIGSFAMNGTWQHCQSASEASCSSVQHCSEHRGEWVNRSARRLQVPPCQTYFTKTPKHSQESGKTSRGWAWWDAECSANVPKEQRGGKCSAPGSHLLDKSISSFVCRVSLGSLFLHCECAPCGLTGEKTWPTLWNEMRVLEGNLCIHEILLCHEWWVGIALPRQAACTENSF